MIAGRGERHLEAREHSSAIVSDFGGLAVSRFWCKIDRPPEGSDYRLMAETDTETWHLGPQCLKELD